MTGQGLDSGLRRNDGQENEASEQLKVPKFRMNQKWSDARLAKSLGSEAHIECAAVARDERNAADDRFSTAC